MGKTGRLKNRADGRIAGISVEMTSSALDAESATSEVPEITSKIPKYSNTVTALWLNEALGRFAAVYTFPDLSTCETVPSAHKYW